MRKLQLLKIVERNSDYDSLCEILDNKNTIAV